MKLSSTQALSAHLGQKDALRGAYFVFSDEPLLLSEARAELREAIGAEQRQLHNLDDSFNPTAIRNETATGNLFGTRTLLELIGVKALTASQSQALTEIAQAADPEQNPILVATPKPRKAAWLAKLEDVFVVVSLAPIARPNFAGWIKARASKIGLSLDLEAVALIAKLNEGDLSAAAQELDKLLLLVGPGGKASITTVHANMFDSSHDNVFSLREAMAAGDGLRAARALRNLRASGIAEQLVLWALTEEARTLLSLAEHAQAWVPDRSHMNNLKDAAKRILPAKIRSYLASAAQADLLSKGLKTGDPWETFSRLAVSYAHLIRSGSLPRWFKVA